MSRSIRWTVLDNPQAVASTACGRINSIAREAIGRRGVFRIVLAGGSTPEQAYRLLAASENDWSRWQVWFGDERCLPPDHPQRNSQMAAKVLTSVVPIPTAQVHVIPAELGAEQGAEEYTKTLPVDDVFDVVLLGVGEDGHTASLFPGHKHPDVAAVLPVHHAPKPPPDRVSLSGQSLGRCRQLLFLVTGEGKSDAVRRWRSNEDLPVKQIKPTGETEVLIDRQALPD